jgi:hypothetical protein
MARIRIPKNAGQFRVAPNRVGGYMVINDKSGGSKIVIACKSREQAQWLCKKLNDQDHNGEIWM